MFGKKKTTEKILLGNMVEGLPVGSNADLMFKLRLEGAVFFVPSEQKTFEINISKIRKVQWYDETSMEKVIGQSVPGMIIGAVAFGLIGAMIGGRVKTKDVKTTAHFVVIDYNSDGEKQIVIKTNDGLGAMKISDFFKEIKPETDEPQTVTL